MRIQELFIELENLFIEDDQFRKKYIIERIEEQRKRLRALIGRVNNQTEAHLGVKKKTVQDSINDYYSWIVESINEFFQGNFDKSKEIIYDNFFDKNKRRQPLNVISSQPETIFYRIRKNDTYNLFESNKMFHIPFENRELVANQRFSQSGYPCLYLGNSIYCCWEATGRPNIDTCNIIALKNLNQLSFIYLGIPKFDIGVFHADTVYQLILPLVCSLKVSKKDGPFKPEYIIPQNVLSCLIKRNTMEDNLPKFDGILYTSNVFKTKQCLFNNRDLLKNYVIPIKMSKEKGLCQTLVDSFEVSETTSYISQTLTEPQEAMAAYNPEETELYSRTLFGNIEEKLKRASTIFSKIES